MTDVVSIEATVLDVLSEVLHAPPGDLRDRPVLATHDWDSLAQLEALAQLENRLRVTLDLRSYHEVRTLDGLVDLVAVAVTAKSTADRH